MTNPDLRPKEMVWYSVETPSGLVEFKLAKFKVDKEQGDDDKYFTLLKLAATYHKPVIASEHSLKYGK